MGRYADVSIGSGETGQQCFDAFGDHSDCDGCKDHSHEAAHDDARGAGKMLGQSWGIIKGDGKQGDQEQKNTRKANKMGGVFHLVCVNDERRDCTRPHNDWERQRVKGNGFRRRVAVFFPVSPVMRTAFRAVQHVQCNEQNNQPASNAEIINADAKQVQNLRSRDCERAAKDQAIQRCFKGYLALLSNTGAFGHTQENGQVGDRVHDRKQRAKKSDCKCGVHCGHPDIQKKTAPHGDRYLALVKEAKQTKGVRVQWENS
jgi:hypothetical protein